MKQEILELRRAMSEDGIDVFYGTAGDPHGSEYLNDHYKFTEYLSGLISENETLVVTCDGAWIWTDGRYFLQAERELAGSGIELMRMGEDGVPAALEFMKELADRFCEAHEDSDFVIGFDGGTVPASLDAELKKTFSGLPRVSFRWDSDLAEKVWKERPDITPSKIWPLPLSSSGRSAEDKIADMRSAMSAKGAGALLVSDLMETAWLLNLRGGDIEYTPVFFSYILLTQDDAVLYVMDGALPEGDAHKERDLPDCVTVRGYDEVHEDISRLPRDMRVWMDLGSASYSLYMEVPDKENVINETTPVALAKTVKNETEIRSTFNAHIKDAVAVTKFIKWVKEAVRQGTETELSASARLEAFRREQEGCFDLSFNTIAGYGPNGAVIHYAPSPETDLEIRPEGFLLVDSGGQYIDGTTDITRTIAVGPLTQEMITNYTLVLKGHIAFARYEITPETTHKELDGCAREALLSAGLDFNHGLSHGVGHVLSVHEGPAGVRRKTEGPAGLRAGMIMSNEPGVYLAGRYGVRIENEILLKENPAGNLVSVPVTFVPYEREAIDVSMLTDEEIGWVDSYHAEVRSRIMPLLDADTAKFLEEATQPLRG